MTLKDVAEKAGVSTQLVSIVVNGKSKQLRISPATTQRIAKMAQEMGYDHDKSYGARRMVARRSGIKIPTDVIAVCMATHNIERDIATGSAAKNLKQRATSVRNLPFAEDILHGIEVAAYEVGLDVLICRHCREKLPRLLNRGEVDGAIVLSMGGNVMQQIEEMELPTVKLMDSRKSFHNILVDNKQGIFQAVKHLVQLGHKTIAYLGHSADSSKEGRLVATHERLDAYKTIMQDLGLNAQYIEANLRSQNFETAAVAMQRLWKESKGTITAVVCYNDIFAMGAIRGLESCGVRVPADVSVTGFDDTSGQFAYSPLITSVYYDRFKMGQRAVEMLWQSRPNWLAGKPVSLTTEVLPTELVVRESTSRPPKL